MTYLAHFNLKEKPFKLSPDPRFMCLSETHKEAWASLHFGVLDKRGFILLIGDVGTGKTTVINKLLKGLAENILVARISDPGLDQLDFFKFLAAQFGLGGDLRTKGDFLLQLTRFLHQAHADGKTVVVIVDEAQRLSDAMLEEIRLLSNIERQDEKLINIILVGQNELNAKLMADANRAMRQRITTIHKLGPLGHSEVEDFIRFRLKVAGTEERLFTDKAIREITAYSKGNPRLINVICDQALLTAFVQEKHRVDEAIIRQCGRELTLIASKAEKHNHTSAGPHPRASWGATFVRTFLATVLAVGILAASALVGTYLYRPQMIREWIAGHAPPQNGRLTYPVTPETGAVPSAAVPADIADTKEESVSRPAIQPAPATTPAPPVPDRADTSQPPPAQPAAPLAEMKPAEAQAPQPDRPSAAVSAQVAPRPAEARGPEPDRPTPAPIASPPAEALPWPEAKTVFQFPANSNELTEEMYRELDQLVAIVQSRPGTRVVITGYTDGMGGENYNRYLSKFRADVVKSYFIGQGISSSRIASLGRGSQDPVAPDTHYTGRQQNRRVEIELVAAD